MAGSLPAEDGAHVAVFGEPGAFAFRRAADLVVLGARCGVAAA